MVFHRQRAHHTPCGIDTGKATIHHVRYFDLLEEVSSTHVCLYTCVCLCVIRGCYSMGLKVKSEWGRFELVTVL